MAKGGLRYGAGRPGWHGKVEHCRSIDIRRFQREDMLKPGSWAWQWRDSESQEVVASIGIIGSVNHMTLDYSANGVAIREHINITRTACKLGGNRAWFQRPRCQSRVAKLHLRGGRFACRPCQRLAYSSQSEDICGRSWRKQSKLEARLGPNWRKPKGMHHATRERLMERIWQCEEIRENALAAYVERIGFKGWAKT